MPDCFVVIIQNNRELWGFAEGLGSAYFSRKKMEQWIRVFPGALSDTGDLR